MYGIIRLVDLDLKTAVYTVFLILCNVIVGIPTNSKVSVLISVKWASSTVPYYSTSFVKGSLLVENYS